MKELYDEVDLTVIKFDHNDVIVTSPDDGPVQEP